MVTIGSPPAAACRAIDRDSASSSVSSVRWSMLRAALTCSSPVVVLQQQEPAFGVGQLDHGVEDHLQQARQAQLAVQPLVDAQQPPQARLGGLRARRQPVASAPAAAGGQPDGVGVFRKLAR